MMEMGKLKPRHNVKLILYLPKNRMMKSIYIMVRYMKRLLLDKRKCKPYDSITSLCK